MHPRADAAELQVGELVQRTSDILRETAAGPVVFGLIVEKIPSDVFVWRRVKALFPDTGILTYKSYELVRATQHSLRASKNE